MSDLIFYAIIVIFAIYGSKKCAPDSAYDFVAIGAASYASVWALPMTLQIMDSIPKLYRSYAFAALLAVSWLVIFALIRTGIKKMLDNYPVFDSATAFMEMPGTAKIAGLIYGACSGYATAAFLMFTLTFIPGKYPVISEDAFAERADKAMLAYSQKVNFFASAKWNAKQKEYLEQILVKNYRNPVEKTPEPPKKKKKKTQQQAPAAAPAAAPEAAQVAHSKPSAPAPEQNQPDTDTDGKTQNTVQTETSAEKANAGIVFSCLLPVLRADGTGTGFERSVKVGIKLDSHQDIPSLIEAEIPHPTRTPGKTIIRKVKLNLEELDCARVSSLNPKIEVKYTIVDIK